MTESFPNSPLIELAVEVQWHFPEDEGAGSHQTTEPVLGPSAAASDFYDRVAARLAVAGFTQSERLVPRGSVEPMHTAVLSFTKPGTQAGRVIYQIGNGMFGVNAVQPYESWEAFRPSVVQGLEMLFETLDEFRQPQRASLIELRYIDAFQESFLAGTSRHEFLSETLGFKLAVPTAIDKLIDPNGEPKMFLQFFVPMMDGGELIIRTGEATVRNAEAVVLDLTVSHSVARDWDRQVILRTLDSARDVIHSTFVEMTKPVAHILNEVKA